jgi:cytidine deaminase
VQDLLALARTMMVRAHAPYSRFHVGAAVRDEEGGIHGGCNVENVVYPLGLCAEASAISALVGAGKKRVTECLVIGPGPHPISPCGGCRQKLREFASDDLKIHLCGPDGLHRTVTLGELLPLAFGPEHLAKS